MRPEIQSDITLLSDLKNLITEINKENGQLYKIEVLKRLVHDQLKSVLIYTYDNQLTFNVTSKNIEKMNKPVDQLEVPGKLYTLFSLLDSLSSREITGHKALNDVNYYISMVGEEYRDVIYRIIDKDLKTRVGIRVLNKIFDNLINHYTVALGESETKADPRKLTYFKERWYSSRKMDGLRGTIVIDNLGSVTIRTREGHLIHTLENLKAEISKLGLVNAVLDGEVCIVDSEGNESFSAVQRQWNKKNYQIENPKFCMFDYIPLHVFKQGYSEGMKLSNRRSIFEQLITENQDKWEDIVIREEDWQDKSSSHSIILLEQTLIISPEQLDNLKENSLKKKWEGLIFRKDVEYLGDRSFDIIKHKLMSDDEFTVIDVEKGPFRCVNKQEDGSTLEETEITMTNIVIDYKGERVSVGSGFSLSQRRHWYLHPEEIVGTTITVQYFEETVNKEGKPNLRFPIFKGIRTVK